MSPKLNSVIIGKNVCILAYGSSGSGETYSMFKDNNHACLFQKSIQYIFEEGQKKIKKLKIGCSMFEIYNETFVNLIHGKKYRNGTKNFVEVPVESVHKFIKILKISNDNRKMACTKKSNQSSRSHLMLKLSLNGLSQGSNKNLESSILL